MTWQEKFFKHFILIDRKEYGLLQIIRWFEENVAIETRPIEAALLRVRIVELEAERDWLVENATDTAYDAQRLRTLDAILKQLNVQLKKV